VSVQGIMGGVQQRALVPAVQFLIPQSCGMFPNAAFRQQSQVSVQVFPGFWQHFLAGGSQAVSAQLVRPAPAPQQSALRLHGVNGLPHQH
jgi:hypothetical protein